MKKVFLFALVLIALSATAQKDFNYNLTFTKVTVITALTLTKGDTVVKAVTVTVDKTSSKLMIYMGGGPAKAYLVYFRGAENGTLIYSAGLADILVAPFAPAMKITEGEKTYLYH